MESQPQEQKALINILLIGAVGVGKSATCKSLCEDVDNVFISSPGKDSCTKNTINKKVHWKNTYDEFMLIDTQGFLDGEKNDDMNQIQMIVRLQKIEYINAIFIVLNGQEPRINDQMKSMLKLFYDIFGQKFLTNIGFIFTRWGQSKRDKKSRAKSEDSEELKIKNIHLQLLELGILEQENQFFECFFIDNDLGKYTEEEIEENFSEEEIKAHIETLMNIRAHSENLNPFDTINFKKVISEHRLIKEQLDKVEKMLADEIEKHQQEKSALLQRIQTIKHNPLIIFQELIDDYKPTKVLRCQIF